MSSCWQSVAEQDADAQAEANLQLYNHFTNLVSSLPSSNGLGLGSSSSTAKAALLKQIFHPFRF